MAKVQKVSTREFKEEAVRLAQTSGKPITQIARETRPFTNGARNWLSTAQKHFQAADIRRHWRKKIAVSNGS
jgi:transposase